MACAGTAFEDILRACERRPRHRHPESRRAPRVPGHRVSVNQLERTSPLPKPPRRIRLLARATSSSSGWSASRCGFATWRPGWPASSSPRTGRLGFQRWRPCGCAGPPTNPGEHDSSDPSWHTRPASRNWTTWSATWARSPMPGAAAMSLACGWPPRILPGPAQRCCNRPIRTPRLAAGTRRCLWPWTSLLFRPATTTTCWSAWGLLAGRLAPSRSMPQRVAWRRASSSCWGRTRPVHRAAAQAAGGVPRRWQPAPVPRPTRQEPIPLDVGSPSEHERRLAKTTPVQADRPQRPLRMTA